MRESLTANLTNIASAYMGEWCFVRCHHMVYSWGLAHRTPTGAEILLHPELDEGDLGYVFFHEVAHFLLGHVRIIDTSDCEIDRSAILARLSEPERTGVQGVIDGNETDADALALDLLIDFERRFGDFVTALTG